MAWNQSTGPTKVEPKKPSALRGIIAGVVCVAVAAAVAFFVLSGKDVKPKAKVEKTSGLIKEVKPAAAPKAKDVEPERRPKTAEEKRAGLAQIRNREPQQKIDMETYVSPDPGFKDRWERFKKERAELPFPHMSENEINVILETKPGEMILDTAFHPSFERDFLKSLTVPIIVRADDDEVTANRKRNMIEAKKILKDAYDNGESITDILKEERANLQKAYSMRENMIKVVREMEKDCKTAQEVDDYVKAANLMLDKYGAKHIRLPHNDLRLRIEKQQKGAIHE